MNGATNENGQAEQERQQVDRLNNSDSSNFNQNYNLWDGLEQLKELIQISQGDNRERESASSDSSKVVHPFSRLEPNLSIHHSSSNSPISSKQAISQKISELRNSISSFKSNHNHQAAGSSDHSNRIVSLLKQSSTHLTSISSTISSFFSPAFVQEEILFLPESLHIGFLSDKHPPPSSTSASNSISSSTFSTTQILDFFDSFSKTLTQIGSQYGLESFTDHLVQAGDPRLELETENQKPLPIQTTTLGGRILVIDLDFSLEISSKTEIQNEGNTLEEKRSNFNYNPNFKLRISYASDSSISTSSSTSENKNKRDAKLACLLELKVIHLMNLVFYGRVDLEEVTSDQDEWKFKAPEKGIQLLESFRRNLKLLSRLDLLGGLKLSESSSSSNLDHSGNEIPGQNSSSSNSNGLDLFNQMDQISKYIEKIYDLEKKENQRSCHVIRKEGDDDETKMEIDNDENSERGKKIELRSLISRGHGIPFFNNPNPYLSLIYHIPFKFSSDDLSIPLLQSSIETETLSRKVSSSEDRHTVLKNQIYYLRVEIDLVTSKRSEVLDHHPQRQTNSTNSNLKCSNRSNWALLTEQLGSFDENKLSSLPVISSSDPNQEGIKLSYIIQLSPPVLCTKVTCREIETAVRKHQNEFNLISELSLRHFKHSSREQHSNMSDSKGNHSLGLTENYLHSLGFRISEFEKFGIKLSLTNEENGSTRLKQSKNSKENFSNSNSNSENELFEVSRIPFNDLDEFYRIIEILKCQLKTMDLLQEIFQSEELLAAESKESDIDGNRKKMGLEKDEVEISQIESSKEDFLDLDDLLRDEDEVSDEVQIIDNDLQKNLLLNRKRNGLLPVNLSISYPLTKIPSQKNQSAEKAKYVPMSIEFGFPISFKSSSFNVNGNLTPNDSIEGWEIGIKINRIHFSSISSKSQDETDSLTFSSEEMKRILEFIFKNDDGDEESNSNQPRLVRFILFLENLVKIKISENFKDHQEGLSNSSSIKNFTKRRKNEQESKRKEKEQEEIGDAEMNETSNSTSKTKSKSTSSSSGKSSLKRRRSSGSGNTSEQVISVSSRTRSSSASGSGSGRSRSTSPVKERKR